MSESTGFSVLLFVFILTLNAYHRVIIPVHRQGGFSGAGSVSYSTVSESAQSGLEFYASNGMISWDSFRVCASVCLWVYVHACVVVSRFFAPKKGCVTAAYPAFSKDEEC